MDGERPNDVRVRFEHSHWIIFDFSSSTRESTCFVFGGCFSSVSGEIRPQIIAGNHILIGAEPVAKSFIFLHHVGGVELVANGFIFGKLLGCRSQFPCEIGYRIF